MSDYKFDQFNEEELDSALEHALTQEALPEGIVQEVTPWRKAMNRVLTGLALTNITLNFWCLNYILPGIGTILILLGFRALRKESKWFRLGWIISIARMAYVMFTLILNATIWGKTVYGLPAFTAIAYVNLGAMLLLLVCLQGGFQDVQRKTSTERRSGAATALIVWYLVVCALGLIQLDGLIVGILLLVGYVFILKNLNKLSKELDEAGYAITLAPVRISDKVLVRVLAGIILVGIAMGYGFFNNYPMEYTPVSQSEETQEIKDHLIALGAPESVLDDFTEEDILACRGALRVFVMENDYPVNDGREVTTENGAGYYHTETVYDVEELRITGIAVELPGERESWKLFHHFNWIVDTKFYGTETMHFWPTTRDHLDWRLEGEWTGQVLYDSGGVTYAAPYYNLDRQTYESNNWFFGSTLNSDVFAEFSFPRGGEHCRGYVSYNALEIEDGCITDSWVNYVHQRSFFRYPVQTATEFRMASGMFASDKVFFTVQDALQFYSNDPVLKALGSD